MHDPEGAAPVSRRAFVGTVAAAALGAGAVRPQPAIVAEPGEALDGLRLVNRPERVFRTADPGREGTESWIFTLAVESSTEDPVEPEHLRVSVHRGDVLLRTSEYGAPAAGVLRLVEGVIPAPRRAPDAPPRWWSLVLRLRFTEPRTLAADRVRVGVRVRTSTGVRELEADVAVETYAQKTALLFPFRGPGIVVAGGATNGGHGNDSGQFALDALGLTPHYAPMLAESDERNESHAGWGRLLLAPADGTVVVARGDRPDQPVAGASDPAYYAPEHPRGGDPGNHVVIDHGGGEFSMIAHLRHGSLAVAVGERVRRGQEIGRLGNSGDSSGPHVHYQLQSGPDWRRCDGLPCRFENVRAAPLVRGTWFSAT